ncbi:MAG: DUF1566 domain-containing protein, partial [Aestuariibacter sp.]|nr:DUF1566 domain-containing protein [Aestuariibacter sp.]
FTKLDANGNELDVSAVSWSCVRDNVTGLVWEVKTDDGGLRDKNKEYEWGGDTARLNADFGLRSDDWNVLIDAANTENASGLCGYSDWRVPSREELRSIVSYDRTVHAIDTSFFPNTKDSLYWSSSARAGDSSGAWGVYFDDGGNYNDTRGDGGHVRLVRAGQ